MLYRDFKPCNSLDAFDALVDGTSSRALALLTLADRAADLLDAISWVSISGLALGSSSVALREIFVVYRCWRVAQTLKHRGVEVERITDSAQGKGFWS